MYLGITNISYFIGLEYEITSPFFECLIYNNSNSVFSLRSLYFLFWPFIAHEMSKNPSLHRPTQSLMEEDASSCCVSTKNIRPFVWAAAHQPSRDQGKLAGQSASPWNVVFHSGMGLRAIASWVPARWIFVISFLFSHTQPFATEHGHGVMMTQSGRDNISARPALLLDDLDPVLKLGVLKCAWWSSVPWAPPQWLFLLN